MVAKQNKDGMLSPYRALDLTDEKGLLCGKILGDFGADVIKVEKPGGDPTRNIGPFYHDEPDPERSLLWWAYNTSKRGITLDIETANGQHIFRELVKRVDFVIESFPPGYMDKLGLGYSALEKLNPGVIMVSITPFGQTGPYKDYKAPDIVAWAMGGHMSQMLLTGGSERPPVRIGHHSQAYLHAAAQGAVGALMALYYRGMTGEGQQVDISIRDSAARVTSIGISGLAMMKSCRQQSEPISDIRATWLWPCKDGYVLFVYFGGAKAERWSVPLIRWMESEGVTDDFLKELDWETVNLRALTQEIKDSLEEPTRRFFMSQTKAELLEGAIKHRVMLYPVSTTKDILECVQLAAREYWMEVEHPELGTTITYPGAFIHSSDSEASPRISRRAPLIGEHNQEVYSKELGISRDEMLALKQAKVI